jgi:hypothetical protein
MAAREDRGPEAHDEAQGLAEEARRHNPDETTQRETFEKDLMEEGLTSEGDEIELSDAHQDRREPRTADRGDEPEGSTSGL